MHGSRPFAQFPVPGAEIPVGGLTWVVVHPQHRRRGILRAMINHHFAACRSLEGRVRAVRGRGDLRPLQPGLAANDLRVSRCRAARPASLPSRPSAASGTVRIEEASVDRHGALIDAIATEGEPPPARDRPAPRRAAQPPGLGPVRLAHGAPSARRPAGVPRGQGRSGSSSSSATASRVPTRSCAASRWEVRPRGVVRVSETVVTDPAAAHVVGDTPQPRPHGGDPGVDAPRGRRAARARSPTPGRRRRDAQTTCGCASSTPQRPSRSGALRPGGRRRPARAGLGAAQEPGCIPRHRAAFRARHRGAHGRVAGPDARRARPRLGVPRRCARAGSRWAVTSSSTRRVRSRRRRRRSRGRRAGLLLGLLVPAHD